MVCKQRVKQHLGADGRKQIYVIRTVRIRSVNVVRENYFMVINMGGTAEDLNL